MRLFVAVVPPAEAVADLDSFLDVRRSAADLRWSRAEHLHVTVAFAPAVDERRLDDLLEGLADAAARRTPVSARVAGGGAFPDPAGARVLWAGLTQAASAAEDLELLSRGLRAAATRAGVRVDGRRLHPHVTVARSRVPRPLDDWVRLLDTYVGPPWTVPGVLVLRSEPGPRYDVVAELPLAPEVPAGRLVPLS